MWANGENIGSNCVYLIVGITVYLPKSPFSSILKPLPLMLQLTHTHPCFLKSAPMWSANRTVLSWPRVSVSGVGVLGLGCKAVQLSTTQPCFWLEGFRYSVAPPARTALKVGARSTLTLNPSHMTSPPATGRTPLPLRLWTLDITAGGTWLDERIPVSYVHEQTRVNFREMVKILRKVQTWIIY